MIPKRLSLSGFTSYRKTVELDFTKFNLACISGPNGGAGKSSILDAITYALYGKARKSDDALINSASDKAESMLDFEYEGQTYRVNRSITRGKGSSLDFYILNPPRPQMTASAGKHSPNAQFAKRTLKSSALCAWITKPSSTRRFSARQSGFICDPKTRGPQAHSFKHPGGAQSVGRIPRGQSRAFPPGAP